MFNCYIFVEADFVAGNTDISKQNYSLMDLEVNCEYNNLNLCSLFHV